MQDAELTKEVFGQKILPVIRRHLPFWCFFAILLISLIPAIFEVIPQRDVALRYAPMAEAFRDGDFLFAFHPRTSFFHTTFAGIIAWLLKCDGFTACKISSLLFLAAGVFPLFALVKNCYSCTIAEISLLVYVFCSPLLKLGSSGLRDSHKCFLILLSAYALFEIWRNRSQWKGYLWLGVVAGLGIITRGDLVAYMILLLFWGMVLEWKNGFPRKSLAALFLALLCSLPAVIVNYVLTKAAIPEFRFALLFQKYYGSFPGLKHYILICLASAIISVVFSWFIYKISLSKIGKPAMFAVIALIFLAFLKKVTDPAFIHDYTFAEFYLSLFRGLVPYLFIPAVMGIAVRLYRKEWTQCDTFLIVMLAGHTILIVLQIIFFDNYLFVPPRYLIPAAVLEIPWAVYGAMSVWNFMLSRVSAPKIRLVQTIGILLLVAGVIGLLYDYYRITIHDYTRKKDIAYRQGLAEIGKIIRNDYKGPKHPEIKLDLEKYIINRNPPIMFVQHLPDLGLFFDISLIRVAVYYAQGRIVDRMDEADYIVEQISKYATEESMKRLHAEWKEVAVADLGKRRHRIWKKKEKK